MEHTVLLLGGIFLFGIVIAVVRWVPLGDDQAVNLYR